MKPCDSHIHVGQFYDRYTSPRELIELTSNLGIDKYAVSSTTICEEDYPKVLLELEYLSVHDGDRAYPVLWVTPTMLADEKVLNIFLDSGLKWCCLKIHPDLHPYLWSGEEGYFEALLDLSADTDMPILIHTGGNSYSEAKVWRDKLKGNPNHIFILAHCRPCDQTMEIMQECENVYGDLAFVDKHDMATLLHSEIATRLLWGSDIPIVDFYLNQANTDYYNEMIDFLENESSSEILKLTLEENFNKIFKIHEIRYNDCLF